MLASVDEDQTKLDQASAKDTKHGRHRANISQSRATVDQSRCWASGPQPRGRVHKDSVLFDEMAIITIGSVCPHAFGQAPRCTSIPRRRRAVGRTPPAPSSKLQRARRGCGKNTVGQTREGTDRPADPASLTKRIFAEVLRAGTPSFRDGQGCAQMPFVRKVFVRLRRLAQEGWDRAKIRPTVGAQCPMEEEQLFLIPAWRWGCFRRSRADVVGLGRIGSAPPKPDPQPTSETEARSFVQLPARSANVRAAQPQLCVKGALGAATTVGGRRAQPTHLPASVAFTSPAAEPRWGLGRPPPPPPVARPPHPPAAPGPGAGRRPQDEQSSVCRCTCAWRGCGGARDELGRRQRRTSVRPTVGRPPPLPPYRGHLAITPLSPRSLGAPAAPHQRERRYISPDLMHTGIGDAAIADLVLNLRFGGPTSARRRCRALHALSLSSLEAAAKSFLFGGGVKEHQTLDAVAIAWASHVEQDIGHQVVPLQYDSESALVSGANRAAANCPVQIPRARRTSELGSVAYSCAAAYGNMALQCGHSAARYYGAVACEGAVPSCCA